MRGKKLLLSLCTLLLLALGCALPRLSAMAQDRRLAREVIHRTEPQIDLTLNRPAELLETLALMGEEHTEITLGEGGGVMTRAEAQAAAAEVREALTAAGLLREADFGTPAVEAVLAAAQGERVRTAIVWRCVWRDGDGETALWLDDESGRLAAFQSAAAGGPGGAAKKEPWDWMELMERFCRRYYEEYAVGQAEKIRIAPESGGEQYLISIAGETLACQVPVAFSEGILAFNSGSFPDRALSIDAPRTALPF